MQVQYRLFHGLISVLPILEQLSTFTNTNHVAFSVVFRLNPHPFICLLRRLNVVLL